MGKSNIILVILAITWISSLGLTFFDSHSHAKAAILGLNAPSEISDGDHICLRIIIRNNDDKARSFFIGASILIIGEMEWVKLPGWGYTNEISPFNTTIYVFKPKTVLNITDVRYYDIKVTIWSNSSKNNLVYEGWYPARTNYWWN